MCEQDTENVRTEDARLFRERKGKEDTEGKRGRAAGKRRPRLSQEKET